MPQEQTPGARNLLVKGTYKPGRERTCESVKVKGRILGFCFIVRLRHKGGTQTKVTVQRQREKGKED